MSISNFWDSLNASLVESCRARTEPAAVQQNEQSHVVGGKGKGQWAMGIYMLCSVCKYIFKLCVATLCKDHRQKIQPTIELNLCFFSTCSQLESEQGRGWGKKLTGLQLQLSCSLRGRVGEGVVTVSNQHVCLTLPDFNSQIIDFYLTLLGRVLRGYHD